MKQIKGASEACPSSAFTGKRLPAQVFSKTSGKYLWFEFARAFDEGAWRVFARLAREFSDKSIRCCSLNPDHLYYTTHFGRPADFEFEATGAAEVYVQRMHEWPPTSIADAVAYHGELVAWAGNTASWECWGQRDVGLCLLRLDRSDALCKEMIALSDQYVVNRRAILTRQGV